LVEQLKLVNQELYDVHLAEVSALAEGALSEFEALQYRLEKTREYRDVVVDSLKQHLAEHGCEE
jgi:hypothetical protein